MGKKKKLEKKIKNFKILGAKNHRKYLHKHSGPPFQIRGGPGSFSIADVLDAKGQIISKGFLMSSISSKKRTKEFDFTSLYDTSS